MNFQRYLPRGALGVLKDSAKVTEKYLCGSLFLNKIACF